MADLYTLGNFTIDDIVLHDGRTRIGTSGGNVLYAALGAQLWCNRVGILARLGNDLPAPMLTRLQSLNLELGLIPVDLPNIHNWALYERDGARQFVPTRASGSYDALSLRGDEIARAQRNARAYHIASMPVERQAELVRALKRPSNLVSLDPHELWIAGNEPLHMQMMAQVDCYVPSREEARLLFGRDDPAAAAREFGRQGPRVIVVKIGAEGSLVFDARTQNLTHVPIYPVAVIDETGAGDTFCGGFLAGYLETGDAVLSACRGTVSASYCVEHLGAFPEQQPTRQDMEMRLQYVSERVKQDRHED